MGCSFPQNVDKWRRDLQKNAKSAENPHYFYVDILSYFEVADKGNRSFFASLQYKKEIVKFTDFWCIFL